MRKQMALGVFLFFLPIVPLCSQGLTYTSQVQDLSGRDVFRVQNRDDPQLARDNYPDQNWPLMQVPENWKSRVFPGYDGVVWYRLTINFSEIPKETPGVFLGQGVDLDWTYFNGEIIGHNGRVGEGYRTNSYDAVRLYQIPTHLIHTGPNTLAIRVQNFYDQGGFMRGPFYLGSFETLIRDYNIGNLVFLMMIALYLYIAFTTFLTAIHDPKNPVNWMFIIFVLLLSLYFCLRNQLKYEIWANYEFWKHWEYLSIVLAALSLFIYENLYINEKFTKLDRVFIGGAGLSFVAILLIEDPRIWVIINLTVNQAIWAYFMFVTILRLIRVLKKSPDSWPYFVGIVIVFLSFISDMLVNQNLELLKNWGFTGQVFFTAFVVSVSFIRSHQVEKLRQAAATANFKLNQILDEQSRQLAETQKRLAYLQDVCDGIISRLKIYMEEKKVFLNPDLTLESLAKSLGVSRNHLSFAINQGLEKSFADFVNEYRIKEFLAKLENETYAQENILTLAFDVGFSSKPTFNAVFKQFVGMTPSEYRKARGMNGEPLRKEG